MPCRRGQNWRSTGTPSDKSREGLKCSFLIRERDEITVRAFNKRIKSFLIPSANSISLSPSFLPRLALFVVPRLRSCCRRQCSFGTAAVPTTKTRSLRLDRGELVHNGRGAEQRANVVWRTFSQSCADIWSLLTLHTTQSCHSLRS